MSEFGTRLREHYDPITPPLDTERLMEQFIGADRYRQRRRPVWAMVAAAILTLIVIGAVGLMVLGSDEEPDVIDPPTTITTTTTTPPTTVAATTTVSTSVPEATRSDSPQPWSEDEISAFREMCHTLNGDPILFDGWRDLFAESAVVTLTDREPVGLFEDIGGPDDFDGDGLVTPADALQFHTALLGAEQALEGGSGGGGPPHECRGDTLSTLTSPRRRTATFWTNPARIGLIIELEYPIVSYTESMRAYEQWVFDSYPELHDDLFRGPCCQMNLIQQAQTIPHHTDLMAEYLGLPTLATATELIDAWVAAWNNDDPDAVAALFTEDASYTDPWRSRPTCHDEDSCRQAWQAFTGREAIRDHAAAFIDTVIDVQRTGNGQLTAGRGGYMFPVTFSSDTEDSGIQTGVVYIAVENEKLTGLSWDPDPESRQE